MKNIALFLSLIIITQFSFAQESQELDPRLVEYLGAENISTMQAEYPDKLAYYQHFIDNMLIVQDMDGKELSSYPTINDVVKINSSAPDLTEETDFSAINPFFYNFGNFGEQKIFRIGNTNLALIARPESWLRSEYLKLQGE
jgi:hypothetical protein